MIEIATPINNFLPSGQIAPVSPSEQVFVLTASQLKAIIAGAVTEALESFNDGLSRLKQDLCTQSEEIARLKASCEADNQHLANLIGEDRKRISAFEQQPRAAPIPAGNKTSDRIEKLRSFLKPRGSGATFQEIERLLNIRPNQMTKLVSQLDKRSFEIFARSGDRRQRVIRLKARIIQ